MKFQIDGPPRLAPVEQHRLKQENAALRKEVDRMLGERLLDERLQTFLEAAMAHTYKIPDWASPRREDRKHVVIPLLEFSDAHFDEEVRSAEVNGLNQYNRPIALERLKALPVGVAKVARNYLRGFSYPGIVVAMLGDNFSGTIHEELVRTNLDTMFGSILFWVPQQVAFLRSLADEFGKVWVVSVAGNHGRETRKPIAKLRARDNFDWLFTHLVARELAGDKRFTFYIPEAQKAHFSVYNTKFIASHGDEAKGGSGIAGMLSPQLITMARMKNLHDFHFWLLGHWHHRAGYRGVKVNGSLKGYDEFALLKSFDYQEPCQDLSFLSPSRGIISEWPVYVEAAPEAAVGRAAVVRFQ